MLNLRIQYDVGRLCAKSNPFPTTSIFIDNSTLHVNLLEAKYIKNLLDYIIFLLHFQFQLTKNTARKLCQIHEMILFHLEYVSAWSTKTEKYVREAPNQFSVPDDLRLFHLHFSRRILHAFVLPSFSDVCVY